MKKIYFLVLLFTCAFISVAFAQEEEDYTPTYTEAFEAKFSGVNTELAATGYIYDRAIV